MHQESIIKQNLIKLVKHNRIRSSQGRRDENNKAILQFFEELNGRIKGMRGFAVMNDSQDPQESIVLTFWETKEYMDAFYQPDNRVLSSLVEKLKPSFEEAPERKDYRIQSLVC